MAARLCDTCNERWPTTTDFKTCPACLVDTIYSRGLKAISKKEALSAVNHIKFSRYYRKWEQKREERGDPSPELLGALDAREAIKLERAFRK